MAGVTGPGGFGGRGGGLDRRGAWLPRVDGRCRIGGVPGSRSTVRSDELVDQFELGRGFARHGRQFVVRRRQVHRPRDQLRLGLGLRAAALATSLPAAMSRIRRTARTRPGLRLTSPAVRSRVSAVRPAARPAAPRHQPGRRRGRRHHQRNQPDIRAAADALQHHAADADRRLDAALAQRLAARLIEAGLGEIAKVEQRTRGVAGADEHAVACEGRDRRIDAFDQALQPFDQRHRAARRLGGRDQDAVAAVGEFEPRAAAGHQRAERRAKAAQPLQPDRAAGRTAARRVAPPGGGAGPRDRMILPASTAPLAAPNSRAPSGLAHRIRVPSLDHSQTGRALVACTASRGSPTPRNWNSALFIVVTS